MSPGRTALAAWGTFSAWAHGLHGSHGLHGCMGCSEGHRCRKLESRDARSLCGGRSRVVGVAWVHEVHGAFESLITKGVQSLSEDSEIKALLC